MANKYKATVAIVVNGVDRAPGESFMAEPEEVAGLLELGAVKPAPGRPPKQDDDED